MYYIYDILLRYSTLLRYSNIALIYNKMETFSQIYKNRRKRKLFKKVMSGGISASSFVLLSLAEAGKISIESFLPKKYSFTALGRKILGLDEKETPWKEKTLRNNISKLIKSGLVEKDIKKKVYILTNEGKKFVSFVNQCFSAANKKWDGRLRMVFYDIPMEKNNYRHWLNSSLRMFGYKQMQKSVFIGKHPLPESFIEDISSADLDSYIYLSTIKEISNKEEIIKLLED